MSNVSFQDILKSSNKTLEFDIVLENSKAHSGGERDFNFLKYLADSGLLMQSEYVLSRTIKDFDESFFSERYRKLRHETEKHYICRTLIQEELFKYGIRTYAGIDVGNMNVLRSNCSYDIVTYDFLQIIDIGLTSARNFFKGLTDLRVGGFFLTNYFDDYTDDIIFSCFTRSNDQDFLNAVADYEDSFRYVKDAHLDAGKKSAGNPPDFGYVEGGNTAFPSIDILE